MSSQQRDEIPAWKNTSKKGGEYVSFTIDGRRYSMFENTKKKDGSNQPDYLILRSPESSSGEEPQTAS